MKLTTTTQVSVDGVMQGPGANLGEHERVKSFAAFRCKSKEVADGYLLQVVKGDLALELMQ